jgi:hypothetical protein
MILRPPLTIVTRGTPRARTPGSGVKVVPSAVVPPGGAGVGVAREVLYVPQRSAGVQGARDRGVAEAVRRDPVGVGYAGAAGEPLHGAVRLRPAHGLPEAVANTGPASRPAR